MYPGFFWVRVLAVPLPISSTSQVAASACPTQEFMGAPLVSTSCSLKQAYEYGRSQEMLLYPYSLSLHRRDMQPVGFDFVSESSRRLIRLF